MIKHWLDATTQTNQEVSQEKIILLLTIDQVMERLQLGRNTVYLLINKEGLPVQRFGRAVRIDPKALEAWLQARGK